VAAATGMACGAGAAGGAAWLHPAVIAVTRKIATNGVVDFGKNLMRSGTPGNSDRLWMKVAGKGSSLI
jgi:hypothetical protein